MVIEISVTTSTSKQSSEAGMIQVQPVVEVDGLEGVDALGTPIRHPEAGGDVSEKKVLRRLDVRLFSW